MVEAVGDLEASGPSADSLDDDFRDFFENVSVACHWVDARGIILRANQAELILLGYEHDEYVGHDIREFYAEPEEAAAILGRLADGEVVHEFDAELICKDGSRRTVAIDSSVMWRHGTFVHTRCVTRDVSYRKAADDLTLLLNAVVESSDDAIISKDLDGVVRS